MSTILVVGAIVAGAGALTSAGLGIANAQKNKNNSLMEAAKQKRLEKRLQAFESSRQAVLDNSSKIRAMKDQVFNPYAQLGVATKAADMKIEETDKSLANTLDAVRAMGGGGATALAQAAAMSKATVAASIETQELENQKLRIEGEAKVMGQKMAIEQAALAEEAAVYDRQETRDIRTSNRMAGLADRAGAQAIAYDQAAQAAGMEAAGAVTQAGMSAVTMGLDMGLGSEALGIDAKE